MVLANETDGSENDSRAASSQGSDILSTTTDMINLNAAPCKLSFTKEQVPQEFGCFGSVCVVFCGGLGGWGDGTYGKTGGDPQGWFVESFRVHCCWVSTEGN